MVLSGIEDETMNADGNNLTWDPYGTCLGIHMAPALGSQWHPLWGMNIFLNDFFFFNLKLTTLSIFWSIIINQDFLFIIQIRNYTNSEKIKRNREPVPVASREQWVPKGLAVNRNIAPSVSQIVDDFFEGLDPPNGAATKAAASGVKYTVSGELRRSDKPPEQSGGLAPMERLMYVMDVMHDHAISHAQTDDFPDCLEKMDPEGVYQKRFWKDVEAVQGVAAEKQGRGVQVPKKK